MSDKKQQTKKQNSKPTEKPPEEILKALRKDREAIRTQCKSERKTYEAARKDSLREAMGARGRGIKELTKPVDEAKAKIADTCRAAIVDAEKAHKNAIAEANSELELAREIAKDDKKEQFTELNSKLKEATAPIIAKHKVDMEETEDSFKTEMAAIDKKEEQALAAFNGEIEKLEKKLGKRKKGKPKPKDKPAEAGAAA